MFNPLNSRKHRLRKVLLSPGYVHLSPDVAEALGMTVDAERMRRAEVQRALRALCLMGILHWDDDTETLTVKAPAGTPVDGTQFAAAMKAAP